MVYDNLAEKINFQTGRIALAVIGVAVICVCVTAVMAKALTGWVFLAASGVFLVAAVIGSHLLVNHMIRPFIAVEKGIAEFSHNKSFRYNEEAAAPAIRDTERDLNALFDEICGSDEASSELIRNISHEVKTPLTSLKIVAEGIKDGVFPADAAHVKLMLDDVDRIDETVTAIKTYSSLDSEHMVSEPVDLMPVLMESYERAKRIAPDGVSVEIKGELDPEHETLVAAQPSVLATVFDSISSNAFEHADGMGMLEFSFKTMTVCDSGSEPRQMLKVSIADDGTGIATPEKMIRAFWKGDASRTTGDAYEKPSLGLGLSICDKMMSSLGGQMGITSKLGMGTCVSLWFPIAE